MKIVNTTLLPITHLLLILQLCYAQEASLSIYGYLDLVGRDIFEREFPNGAKEDPPPTFSLLRTHIILNSRLSEDWRAFVNIRFLNGADLGMDPAHSNKGEINMLEGWFGYRYRSWLKIRGGQFLAPFGYFNTRKFQSPIFNTVVLPIMYEEEFLHRASAGTIIPPLQNLQILGKLQSETWTIGYNIYIGNGSSTDKNNLDINMNKGWGTRFWIEPSRLNLTLGTSYYSEKGMFSIKPYQDTKAMILEAQSQNIPMNEVIPILPLIEESETRHTIGVDTRFLTGNFEIRGEFVRSRISDLALVDASTISDTNQTYNFDSTNFSKTFYYLNINYTLFEKVTPFFEINVFNDPRHYVFRNELRRLSWGVSFRPISSVVIKLEYHNHIFDDEYTNFKSFQMFWTAISILFN